MSIIYFTNNADSGDGSLRQALADASGGDSILPSSETTWTSDLIEIALTSQLAVSKSLTIGDHSKRIRLNGQGASRLVFCSGTLQTFNSVDFVNGWGTSSTAGGVYVYAGSATFNRCRFLGNRTQYYGAAIYSPNSTTSTIILNDCEIAGNNTNTVQAASAACTFGSATTVEINRCTFAGNTTRDVRFQSGATGSVQDTLAQTMVSADSIELNYTAITPSTVGFIAAPPDTIEPADWSNTLYEDWDVRLAPSSPYLSGATSNGGVDLLGHTRKANGALGAYEGSWIVCDSAKTIDASTTCDYLVVNDDATLSLNVEDKALEVAESASISDTAAIVGKESSWSFVVVPVGTSTSATCTRCNVVQSSAYISAASATQSSVIWAATSLDVPIVIQRADADTTWTTIATSSGGSYPGTFVVGETLRLYDGVSFTETVVQNAAVDIDFHPWSVYDATISVDSSPAYTVTTEYLMMSSYYNRGETPVLFARIQDSATGTAIERSAVDSISYTCYKVTQSWASEVRTAVSGHSNVSIDTTAILDSLVTDDSRWTTDTTGYNFVYEPDSRTNALLPDSGDYVLVVTVKFTAGNPCPISYDIEVS